MSQTSLEQRMQAVEYVAVDSQQAFPVPDTDPNWLDKLIGSMRDEPVFEGVLALGRGFRIAT
jgi:hypothetical protein